VPVDSFGIGMQPPLRTSSVVGGDWRPDQLDAISAARTLFHSVQGSVRRPYIGYVKRMGSTVKPQGATVVNVADVRTFEIFSEMNDWYESVLSGPPFEFVACARLVQGSAPSPSINRPRGSGCWVPSSSA